MRELSLSEVESVNGAGVVSSTVGGFEIGAAFGTIGGAIVTGTGQGAIRGGAAGALFGACFGLGYGIGTVGYDTFSNWYYS